MQNNRLIALSATVLVALATAAFALGAPNQTGGNLVARLNTMQELPQPKATRGRGRFIGNIGSGTLRWRLTFSG